MAKFIFRNLETTDGERTYNHYGIHAFGDSTTHEEIEEFMEELLATFWGDSGRKEDEYYWFFGEIMTKIFNWYYIDEDDYNVLAKFI
jgi:hypothetical protein